MNSSQNDTESVAGVSLNKLIDIALSKKRLSIPISDEEVAIAETTIDEQNCELPEALRDPLSFLHKKRSSTPKIPSSNLRQYGDDLGQELAKVAREGGDISDEVRASMDRDRTLAEQESRQETDGTTQ